MTGAAPDLPPIDIRPQDWAILRTLLREYLPHYEIWAFGSRVTGRAKPFSDIDLAIVGDEPLPLAARAALVDALTESDLPWAVDLIDWATTGDAFRAIIARDKVLLQCRPA